MESLDTLSHQRLGGTELESDLQSPMFVWLRTISGVLVFEEQRVLCTLRAYQERRAFLPYPKQVNLSIKVDPCMVFVLLKNYF